MYDQMKDALSHTVLHWTIILLRSIAAGERSRHARRRRI